MENQKTNTAFAFIVFFCGFAIGVTTVLAALPDLPGI
jgi:hypothetical protein